jgi:hypothetical protein
MKVYVTRGSFKSYLETHGLTLSPEVTEGCSETPCWLEGFSSPCSPDFLVFEEIWTKYEGHRKTHPWLKKGIDWVEEVLG